MEPLDVEKNYGIPNTKKKIKKKNPKTSSEFCFSNTLKKPKETSVNSRVKPWDIPKTLIQPL